MFVFCFATFLSFGNFSSSLDESIFFHEIIEFIKKWIIE